VIIDTSFWDGEMSFYNSLNFCPIFKRTTNKYEIKKKLQEKFRAPKEKLPRKLKN
jgi:hypothetical protein